MDKKQAVFVDRDGTIIEQVEALTDPVQLKLLPGAAEAIADLNRRGFLAFGLTNQPIIEKGLLTEAGLKVIHEVLQKLLAKYGAYLDAIYTCPHKYRAEGQCRCRKPGLKLLEDAQAEFPIDTERSWLVGDRLRDIETGRRAGIKTVLVTSSGPSDDDKFFPDTKPDHTAPDLRAAVKFIT
jgi:D-glycero-D-manno-heptose 1,7-bisphosphate phosphatase